MGNYVNKQGNFMKSLLLFGEPRNGLRLFVLLGVVGLTVWIFVLDSHSLLRTEKVMATITEVEIKEIKSHGNYRNGVGNRTNHLVQLELPDGKFIKLTLPQQPPKIGTKVPISISVYDDGKRYYNYVLVNWFYGDLL